MGKITTRDFYKAGPKITNIIFNFKGIKVLIEKLVFKNSTHSR